MWVFYIQTRRDSLSFFYTNIRLLEMNQFEMFYHNHVTRFISAGFIEQTS